MGFRLAQDVFSRSITPHPSSNRSVRPVAIETEAVAITQANEAEIALISWEKSIADIREAICSALLFIKACVLSMMN